MAVGVGGVSQQQALATLSDMTVAAKPIALSEYQQRIEQALGLMAEQRIDVMLINAGTNLRYFTGVNWYASERLVAALLFADGRLVYVLPHFEIGSIAPLMLIKGETLSWQEHQDPYALCAAEINAFAGEQATLALDESAQFFIADGLLQHLPKLSIRNARPVTAGCRMQKSAAELALMQVAMDMTLAVHKAAASILYAGISTEEVTEFIHLAHKKVGAAAGSYFCIVLFGEDSAFPHGVARPKTLADNEMVLIDTGCKLHGYTSDITRSYVFGEASTRHREIWQHEKNAQAAAFNAAKLGDSCQEVDRAARQYLQQVGFGPEYLLPGLPHRTGHGIGMDIHEWPYLVEGNEMPLAVGMCFSNEPMLVLPGEFGVRLEDHFYMTPQGPRWFTEPSYAVDDPFGFAR